MSRACCHSIPAIRNYVDKFKRVISLYQSGFEIHTIAFLVKVSAPLATEYIKFYQSGKILTHREQEINSFLKKDRDENIAGGCHD